MVKNKKTTVFILLISIIVLLTGCVQNPSGSNEKEATVTVTDSIGREVQVPQKVERIAALYSFAGYAVCVLGSGNELVAVPDGLQRDLLLIQLFPEVANASVPRKSGAINAEELLRIKPDLVIVRKDSIADGKEAEKLDKTGIPYIVVDFATMAEERKAIEIIGKVIGKLEEAIRFNNYFVDVIERVNTKVGDIPVMDKVRLFYAENQATRATHETSVAADWTRAAGVINVSVGEDVQSQSAEDALQLIGNDYYASIEQILRWDPEVIIVNETAAFNLIKGHPQWSGIKAVREGRVYQLPNGISRWGHPGSVETPLALLWTAKTVYPDKFIDVSMEDETYYFYKTFFNIELDDEMIATVLKGGDLREPK